MGILSQNFNPPDFDKEVLRQECDRIAGIISRSIRPVMIILFGSAATNDFHAFSDIDLLIVLENDHNLKTVRHELAAAKILPKWPCDYLFATLERFEKMKDIGGPIFMAHHCGRILYDQRAVV